MEVQCKLTACRKPPPTSHVAEGPAEPPEEHLDKLPGDVFLDGSGRLRRTCRYCGSVIPYGTFGGRRYCTTRCRNTAARKRRQADPAKLEADRRMAREANRRAYGTPEGRARIQASQRRWRQKKAAESVAKAGSIAPSVGQDASAQADGRRGA